MRAHLLCFLIYSAHRRFAPRLTCHLRACSAVRRLWGRARTEHLIMDRARVDQRNRPRKWEAMVADNPAVYEVQRLER